MRFDTADPAFGGDPYQAYGSLRAAGPLAGLLHRGRRWELAEPPALRNTWQFRGPSRLVLSLS